MYKRNILDHILRTLKESPVTLLTGARQTGKTTLVQSIAKHSEYSYTTFDDLFAQAAADANPIGFIDNLAKPAVLDEIQTAPKLFLPIKKDVDQHRIPGRYFLTGSANPLIVPRLGDSLAGRMQLIQLWPLSQGELHGIKDNFIEQVFSSQNFNLPKTGITRNELIKILVKGSYPSLQTLDNEASRYSWCNSYLTTLIQKDISDLAKIENLHSIPNILKVLASRSGCLLNERDLARTVDVPVSSTHRYVQLLQNLFLISFLPGWFRNMEKRVIKAPKIYFVDTAILLHLLGANEQRLSENPSILGHITENFVWAEVIKQLSWNEPLVNAYHFRSHDGSDEVDIVLESTSGKIVGIEIKTSETVSSGDFKGLKNLQAIVGKDFVRGVVLYVGSQSLSFGPNLFALPISSLWAPTS